MVEKGGRKRKEKEGVKRRKGKGYHPNKNSGYGPVMWAGICAQRQGGASVRYWTTQKSFELSY